MYNIPLKGLSYSNRAVRTSDRIATQLCHCSKLVTKIGYSTIAK